MPTANVSMNTYKITGLGDATTNTDALNRQTADSRYYQSNVVLNSITAPTGDVSLNSNKITNLATPTLANDATTKDYVDTNVGISQTNADARYYMNTTTLNNITAPIASLSLNS